MKTGVLSSLFGLALLSGCAREDLPETAPVSGKVMHNGQPLTSGTITFHPQEQGNPGYGEIQEDGTFRLTTYDFYDGAVLGPHVVTIEMFLSPDGGPPPLPGSEADTVSKVPPRYSDPESSPLRFTVKPGDNKANFPLED